MYIGIFKMKIVLLLALASVGLCNDYGGNQQPPIILWPGGSGGGGYTSGGRGSSGTESSSSSGGTVSSSSGGTVSSSSGGTGSSSSSGGTVSSSSGGTGSSSSSGGTGSSSSELTWKWSSGSDTYKCNPHKNENAKDPKCLENALQTAPKMLEIGGSIICRHLNNKENNTDEYYKELKGATSFFGRCLGCELGQLSGLSGPLGDVGAQVGGTVAETLKAVDRIKGALGIAKPIHNLFCALLGPVLAENWMENLVGKDGSKVTGPVKTLLCQDETKLDVIQTITTLKGAGCLRGDMVIPDDVLENLTEKENSALRAPLTGLVRGMKGDLLDKGFLGKVICTAGKIVTDVLDTVGDILGEGRTSRGGGGGGDSSSGGGLLGGLLGGGSNGGGLGLGLGVSG